MERAKVTAASGLGSVQTIVLGSTRPGRENGATLEDSNARCEASANWARSLPIRAECVEGNAPQATRVSCRRHTSVTRKAQAPMPVDLVIFDPPSLMFLI